MTADRYSAFRVPIAAVEAKSFVGRGLAAILRFVARKPRNEFAAIVVDPSALCIVPYGSITGPQLKKKLENGRGKYVIVFRENMDKEVLLSLPGIAAEAARHERFVMLLPRRRPPPFKRKPGRDVFNVACDAKTFCALPASAIEKPKTLGYHAGMYGIESADTEFALLSRQVPFEFEPPPSPPKGVSLRIVIPHRGDMYHIRNCLRRTQLAIRGLEAVVHVAFDESSRDEHREIAREFPNVRFWRLEPCGGGPYVPRHILGTAADETYVALQDSDDVPTFDRFARLLALAAKEQIDVLGSHVLDMHEDRIRPKAMRYPVDAVTPLETKPQNTVFHPTTIVRTAALRAAGGFSTVRRFASDREFNLRSFFLSQKLRNIDEFLYVRRMRADSLIHSPETGMNSTARMQLHEIWAEDWRRILNRDQTLEKSSIRATHLDPLPQLVPVETGSPVLERR